MAKSVFTYARVIGDIAGGCHCMFFVTHHSGRARLFLDLAHRMNRAMRIMHDPDRAGAEKALADYLGEWRSNADIHDWGIRRGMLAKETHRILRQWEAGGDVDIDAPSGRRKSAYYLRHASAQIIRLKIRQPAGGR